jgi:hypothetical protein
MSGRVDWQRFADVLPSFTTFKIRGPSNRIGAEKYTFVRMFASRHVVTSWKTRIFSNCCDNLKSESQSLVRISARRNREWEQNFWKFPSTEIWPFRTAMEIHVSCKKGGGGGGLEHRSKQLDFYSIKVFPPKCLWQLFIQYILNLFDTVNRQRCAQYTGSFGGWLYLRLNFLW